MWVACLWRPRSIGNAPTPPYAQDDWLKRAELAVGKGEDDLAREALKRRKAYQVRRAMFISARQALGVGDGVSGVSTLLSVSVS